MTGNGCFKSIAFIFILLLYVCSDVLAMPAIHGSGQMKANASQSLNVSGGEAPYTWSITGGGGHLSKTTGNTVVYTSPGDNPYCVNNAIIHVSDGKGDTAAFRIAVNAMQSSTAAFHTNEQEGACKLFNGQPYCLFRQAHYTCGGAALFNTDDRVPRKECGDKCVANMGTLTCKPDNSCLSYRPPLQDLRNESMKLNGCCPRELAEIIPRTNGMGNVSLIPLDEETAVHFGTGNLFHVQQAGGIALRYNSLDDTDGPLGKNWIHDYGQKLTILKDQQTIILKKDDGNIFIYRLSGDIYSPEPVTRDASRIVKNGDSGYTLTTKDGLSYHFDVRGRLTTVKDRNSRVTSLTYIDSELAGITDFNNRTISFAYTAGKITGITDHMNRATRLTYTKGRLTAITDAMDHTWKYDYSDEGKMIRKASPEGKTVSYDYDTRGRLVSAAASSEKAKTLAYLPHNVTRYTENNGDTWTYTYEPGFAVKTMVTDPRKRETRYHYDHRGHLRKIMEDGRTTTYAYDDRGNILAETDPLNKTTIYTYNNLDQVATVTDPRGNITRYDYNAYGNLIVVTDPAGNGTRYNYDRQGNVLAAISPSRMVMSFVYDHHNNLVTITDPMGALMTMTYDGAGNMLTMTDHANHTTTFQYDASNRLTSTTGHERGGKLTGHDSVLQWLPQDSDLYKKLSLLDGHIRKLPTAVQVVKLPAPGNGAEFNLIHDPMDLRPSLPAEKERLLSARAATEKPDKETLPSPPLAQGVTYTRDSRGNPLTRTTPDKRTTRYTYDLKGRLLEKTDADGQRTKFQYDGNGNMISAGNSHTTYTLTYDENNRLINISDAGNRGISYAYDADGKRVAMTNPSRQTLDLSYNAAGLLTSTGSVSFTYNTSRHRVRLIRPNGTVTSYAYDGKGRLTSIKTTKKNSVLEHIQYTYNDEGTRIQKTSAAAINTPSGDFHYDEAKQLTGIVTTRNGRKREITFTYDTLGRRKERAVIRDEWGKECAGGRFCPVTSYTYDDDSRLIMVKTVWNDKSREVTYSYVPFGRRIAKTLVRDDLQKDHAAPTPKPPARLYVYDQNRIIQEYDGSGALIRTYVHDTVTEAPLYFFTASGSHFFYHTDGDGSITAITNAKGGILQRYGYNALGDISSPPPNFGDVAYTYKGREYDAETGLYFQCGRYYDPQTGRFITPDFTDRHDCDRP